MRNEAWTIDTSQLRPDPEVVEGLAVLSTGQLTEADRRVRPIPLPRLAGDAELCGVAMTCWGAPGDALFATKLADLAGEGDVLVIDAGGATDAAIIGEIWAGTAAANGAQGAVVDGAIRDVEGIEQSDLVVWARAVTPSAPGMGGPGAIGGEVLIAGVPVHAGDVIRADATGLVVVPSQAAAEILAETERLDQEQQGIVDALSESSLGEVLGLDELIAAGRRDNGGL